MFGPFQFWTISLRNGDVAILGLTGDMRKAVAYTQPRTAKGRWADGETCPGKGDYIEVGSGHMRVTQKAAGDRRRKKNLSI